MNDMMQRYWPISPIPEVLVYFAFVLANVWIGQEQVLSESARRQLWDKGLVVVFVLMVVVLCIRAIRRRAVTRVFSAAGLFGFVVGTISWCLYILTEHESEGLSLRYQMIPTIIGYGVMFGVVALLLSALAVSIYWVIKGKAVR